MLLQQQQLSNNGILSGSKPSRTPASRKQVNQLMIELAELKERVSFLESKLLEKAEKKESKRGKKTTTKEVENA